MTRHHRTVFFLSLFSVPALAVAFIALIVGGRYAFGMLGFGVVYSQGDRIGKAIEIRREGLIWKTWEVSLAVTQGGASTGIWRFSIDPDDPKAEEYRSGLVAALRGGGLLRVNYEERLGARPARGATSYLCRGLEPYRRGG